MHPKIFDLDGTLEQLETLAHEEGRTPGAIAAIESAARALHFLLLLGKLEDFQDYLRDVEGAATRATSVEHSFDNMTGALSWLRAQPEPRFGTRVEVAGSPYIVVRQRKELWFLIPAPRLPSIEELEKEL